MGGSFARTGLPQAVTTTSYNVANRLTQWGTATLTYDANGNMTSSGTDGYTWDARNRLVSTLSGASFQYDPFGRRAGKAIGGVTTNFLYDGVSPVQELSGGAPTANLLSGGVDEVFTRTDSNGAASFLTNELGSTLALLGGSGNTLASYSYEPFGNTTITGSSTNPFQYTGRENDVTGLYFYRARYYNPQLQRFISEDPLGFLANSVNFYEYAYDNPTNFTDPSGLQVMAPPAPPQAPPAPAPVAPPAPSRVSPPAPRPPGVGLGLGKVFGAIGLILTSPMDLNPNEPDPATFPKENPLPGRAPSGGKQSKCMPLGYDKQLGGCRYICDDGTVWFEAGPCKPFTYKPWREGFPKYPPIPTAP